MHLYNIVGRYWTDHRFLAEYPLRRLIGGFFINPSKNYPSILGLFSAGYPAELFEVSDLRPNNCLKQQERVKRNSKLIQTQRTSLPYHYQAF